MMWALVAFVGVTALAAAATTFAVLVLRWRRVAGEDTFRCCVRFSTGSPAGLSSRNPDRIRYAFWAHDVLVLRYGLTLRRQWLLPVEAALGAVSERQSAVPWQLGPRVASLSLRLDNGSIVEISASYAVKVQLCGPYLLAALEPQPKIPNPKESP
jgi:hypothetical protein